MNTTGGRNRNEIGDLIVLMESETRKLERSICALRSFNFLLKADSNRLRAIQPNGLFWNTVMDSLRDATIVNLGRLLDSSGDSLSSRVFLKNVEANLEQLGRGALLKRKLASQLTKDDAEKYVADTFVPSGASVAILVAKLDEATSVWDKHYKPIRNKQVAHRDINAFETGLSLADDPDERGLWTIVSTLSRISMTVWQWYHNGIDPDFEKLSGAREASYMEKDVLSVLELLCVGANDASQKLRPNSVGA